MLWVEAVMLEDVSSASASRAEEVGEVLKLFEDANDCGRSLVVFTACASVRRPLAVELRAEAWTANSNPL